VESNRTGHMKPLLAVFACIAALVAAGCGEKQEVL
jgi:hypothetical protein